MDSKIELFHGDCLELYKNIEPKSIDLICTDLPYQITACKWDTIIPFDKLWEMVNYLLKPNGAFITTASQPFTSALVMSNPKMFKCEWIWEKSKATNYVKARQMPMKYHENIIVFSKSKVNYNPQMRCGFKPYLKKQLENYNKDKCVFKDTRKAGSVSESKGDRFPSTIVKFSNDNHNSPHPTAKPIKLMEYLILTYSNENDTIFDCCMGSGTTGLACKNLNRNFIGIEKDEKYFEIAKKRINDHILKKDFA